MHKQQSKTVSILLACTMFVAAVGSFMLFGSMDHRMQGTCPFTTMSGSNCPPSSDGVTMALHHISELENQSIATISESSSLIMIALILIVVAAVITTSFTQLLASFHTKHIPIPTMVESVVLSLHRFLRWLSLRQKRGPDVLSVSA